MPDLPEDYKGIIEKAISALKLAVDTGSDVDDRIYEATLLLMDVAPDTVREAATAPWEEIK